MPPGVGQSVAAAYSFIIAPPPPGEYEIVTTTRFGAPNRLRTPSTSSSKHPGWSSHRRPRGPRQNCRYFAGPDPVNVAHLLHTSPGLCTASPSVGRRADAVKRFRHTVRSDERQADESAFRWWQWERMTVDRCSRVASPRSQCSRPIVRSGGRADSRGEGACHGDGVTGAHRIGISRWRRRGVDPPEAVSAIATGSPRATRPSRAARKPRVSWDQRERGVCDDR
jgi:hypothetical protein